MEKTALEVESKDIAELLYDVYNVPSGICEYIKNTIQRLEVIDNANPSEAMKCLNKIDGFMKYHELYDTYKDELTTIKQALLKAQEQDFNYKNIVIPFFDELVELLATNDIDDMLDKIKENKKVLEIIKEKCLYTSNLNEVATCLNYNYYKERMSKKYDTKVVKTDWNDKVLLDYLKLLTEEEFDLLKEYFKHVD